ncbi:MAG: alpha-1,4-glucan--maltose-1-phosphate maltosyltransferase [Micrococcales bacterium]|nr:alpha-1,4-glucan--maltose-1-phosphate maltosyltransferase [Micrococcales bacterium]
MGTGLGVRGTSPGPPVVDPDASGSTGWTEPGRPRRPSRRRATVGSVVVNALIGRIPIRMLSPVQPEDRWPAKSYAGEVVPFEAVIFREGHGLLGAEVVLVDPSGSESRHRMRPILPGTDRWLAEVQLPRAGEWSFTVRAWADEWATWLHYADGKVAAGQDIDLTFAMGAELLQGRRQRPYTDARKAFLDSSATGPDRLRAAHDARLGALLAEKPVASLTTESATHALRVERARAAVGAWYEFFPRSEGATRRKDGTWKSGTFRTAAQRLPAVAAMGFDVVYIPPVHPIGTTYRKGRNNAIVSEPGDPGSPYAIGSPEGGHEAVHPELGTVADFRWFVRQVEAAGMELAIDIALNASPDHPWVREHPEWFTTRPDGSIAYAENPPKKYQDIYNFNFDNDPEGIYRAWLEVMELWIERGVRIFRVDNPHTKPLSFWERLLGEIYAAHPEVVFLAEAFTRPAMLESLAGAGFQQSYTYFTWRNGKDELAEFFTDLATRTPSYLRPNLFVNTHDILTEFLQFGGPPAYRIRAVLAATASPSWGVYSGYELYENVARPGSEENIDNEKYEFTARDWSAAEAEGRSLAPYLTLLNRIRSEHPALAQLRNLRVHWSDDPAVLVYSKTLGAEFTGTGRPDGLIIVVNLDPHSVRATTVHLDLAVLGLPEGAEYGVVDTITGQRWTWGASNYVRLDAFTEPAHVLAIEYPRETVS